MTSFLQLTKDERRPTNSNSSALEWLTFSYNIILFVYQVARRMHGFPCSLHDNNYTL